MEDPAYSNHPSLQDPERLSHMLPIIMSVDDVEVYKKNNPYFFCVVALRVSDKGNTVDIVFPLIAIPNELMQGERVRRMIFGKLPATQTFA